MGREEQIISERLKKLNELKSQGIDPYPNKFDVKHYSSILKEKYSKLKKDSKTKDKAKIAGRLMSIRDIGKITFAVLQDNIGKIQIIIQEKETPEKVRTFFKKYIDSGDFLGVEGLVLRTKTGELSVLVKKLTILSKSILPLPEKWHGLQDKEERYRKRYLDLVISPEVREVFKTRSRIISILRDFLAEEGFLEVETPNLQTVYGGASATPFETHLNALDIDLFLSISPLIHFSNNL